MFSRFLPGSMSEQDQDPPRWIPYSPPPANAWDRTHDFFRGLLFPVTVVLFGLGLWAGLHWLAQSQERTMNANVQVHPVTESVGSAGDTPSDSARLTVQSRPGAASVWVNGDSVGTTPLRGHSLTPGVYFLSVRAQGYRNADTVVTLPRGGTPEFTFALESRPRVLDESASIGALADQTAEPAPQNGGEANSRTSSSATTGGSDGRGGSSPPVSSETTSESASSGRASDADTRSPATGALRITSEPDDAVVLMDGVRRGRTPLTLDQVVRGSHNVTLQHVGYASWSTTVSTEADTTHSLHRALDPLRGQLRVLAQPWGTIYIDDSLHARESDIWYETELPVGQHRIRVVHPALGEQTRVVELEANEENEVVINLRENREDDSKTQK